MALRVSQGKALRIAVATSHLCQTRQVDDVPAEDAALSEPVLADGGLVSSHVDHKRSREEEPAGKDDEERRQPLAFGDRDEYRSQGDWRGKHLHKAGSGNEVLDDRCAGISKWHVATVVVQVSPGAMTPLREITRPAAPEMTQNAAGVVRR